MSEGQAPAIEPAPVAALRLTITWDRVHEQVQIDANTGSDVALLGMLHRAVMLVETRIRMRDLTTATRVVVPGIPVPGL